MPDDRIITDMGDDAGTWAPAVRVPRSSNDPPTTRFIRTVRQSTGWLMRLLERLIGARIRLLGLERLGDGPVLFVANHFTRMETFILPYLMYLRTGRMVRSLAWHGFFHGLFGRFILMLGARPTLDPHIRHRMVEDLMTGRHDWLIYPEGSMVKDKRLWKDGRYELSLPDRQGPPHTGAAVVALKTLAYRALYLRALREGDTALQQAWEARYHLEATGAVSAKPLRIVPVSITYWPLRPEPNLLTRVVDRLLKTVPEILREELTVEGSLLLHPTDMTVHVGLPLAIARYTDLIVPGASEGDLGSELKRVASALSVLRFRLTRRMMHQIYSGLDVTLDHLFCSALRNLSRDTIPIEDLHRALWLTARQLQAGGLLRTHASLGAELVRIIAGQDFAPLASVVRLAEEERIISREDGSYRINRPALDSDPGFHGIRLRNTIAVIANEIEPVRPAVRLIRQMVNLPSRALARRCARQLGREQIAEAEAERGAMPPTIVAAQAMPVVLHAPRASMAVVLVHGYLASPGEVVGLAQHLRGRGSTVVVVRLAGHGSDPMQLAATGQADWLRSVHQGLALARCLAPQTALVGFSAGGLLALRAAGAGVAAVAAINPALRLRDWRARLARPCDLWNRLVVRLGLPRFGLPWIRNRPAWPDTNYTFNPVHGLAELMRLGAFIRRAPPRPNCPVLVLQADHDEVVDAAGAQQLASLVGGTVEVVAADQHVCLRGPGAEVVWRRIGGFIDEVSSHVGLSTGTGPGLRTGSTRCPAGRADAATRAVARPYVSEDVPVQRDLHV
jgi:alpha-beta hydrolase superfamily lysophospholipase/1-acyl-sn-glycerol-3-phosphate acyltransferase